MRKLIFVVMLVVSGQAASYYRTGNDLLPHCKSGTSFLEGYCRGFITSAVDTSKSWKEWEGLDTNICTPKGVTESQLQRVVVKYLAANPDEMRNAASKLVLKALQEAFPCS